MSYRVNIDHTLSRLLIMVSKIYENICLGGKISSILALPLTFSMYKYQKYDNGKASSIILSN